MALFFILFVASCCIGLFIQGFDLVNFWGKIGGTEGKMNLTEFVEIDLDGYA